jgi:hypothetical protein
MAKAGKAPTGIFSTRGSQKQDGGPKQHADLLAYSKGQTHVRSSETPNTEGKGLTHQAPAAGSHKSVS